MPVIQDIDYLALAPPGLLALAALAVLFVDGFLPVSRRAPAGGVAVVGYVALAGLALTAAVTAVLAVDVLRGTDEPRRTFCQPDGTACSYVVDEFTLVIQLVMLVAAAVVLLIALAEVRDTRLPAGEFHFLLLAALSGALALAAARDLITLVVCLEVVSLPVFALAALRRYDGRSAEGGLKMFLVSVVSTAVMLFGISLVYGVTGSMHLERVASALEQLASGQPAAVDQLPVGSLAAASQVAAVGVVLVLVGFGFKISAVPFHFWAPDTYQGSPIAVAAFLSVVSKMAGFAGLVLVLMIGFEPYAHIWGPLLAVIAAVSMTAGNLVALRQRAAVRLLAWSSIAQAGYILAPLGAAAGLDGEVPRELVEATVGYLAIYAIMNIGAFAVVGFVGWAGAGGGWAAIEDFRGLVRTHPAIAVAMAFFLACLAGLPPGLAGLFAKIVVFRATVSAGYGWLAVLMAVNTVIGLYYYLAWAVRLFTPRADDLGADAGVGASGAGAAVGGGGGVAVVVGRRVAVPLPVALAIGVAVAGTILLSVLPQLVLDIVPG